MLPFFLLGVAGSCEREIWSLHRLKIHCALRERNYTQTMEGEFGGDTTCAGVSQGAESVADRAAGDDAGTGGHAVARGRLDARAEIRQHRLVLKGDDESTVSSSRSRTALRTHPMLFSPRASGHVEQW